MPNQPLTPGQQAIANVQNHATVFDGKLEEMARTCDTNANFTRDERWREAALALLGARRFFRELMSDEDRKVQS